MATKKFTFFRDYLLMIRIIEYTYSVQKIYLTKRTAKIPKQMKKIINTEKAPQAIGPYSQAVQVGNTLYISGQVPINPESGKVDTTTIEEQTLQVMKNIEAILTEAGYSFEHVVKSTCLLSDMANFKAMNDVYAKYYPINPPARAAFAVKELPLGVMVEIETIAYK